MFLFLLLSLLMALSDDRSVKASDKLSYKLVLQRRVDYALSCLDSPMLEDAVISLRTACSFNMVGLAFKDEIDANLEVLNKWRLDSIIAVVTVDRDQWYHPLKKKILLMGIMDVYYTKELQFLISMLSSHNALLEPKDYVETGDRKSVV